MTWSPAQMLSTLLISAQVLALLAVLWGTWLLIGGMRGEGQSADGVARLRRELLDVLKPLFIGLLAVGTLLGLAMWARSPLTHWVQLIAPLSTLVWAVWSHYRARAVLPGELFEALVPLTQEAPAEVVTRAEAWARRGHPLTARALVQTTFQVVDDLTVEGSSLKTLGVDAALQITQDSLADLHEMTARFPLARQLTLADWLYEGERLSARWSAGLTWVGVGRAILNPFTLLDYKGLWRWSKGKPATLFQRELSAWLHQALYVLVSARVSTYLLDHPELQAEGSEALSDQGVSEAPVDQAEPKERRPARLWRLLSFKFTVPLWLYLGLSAVAVIEAYGVLGAGFSVVALGLLWWSIGRATSLEAWREAFERLAGCERVSVGVDDPRGDQARGALARLNERFESRLEVGEPCQGLLELTEQGWLETSEAYARPLRELSDPHPALKHLNATLPDLVATLYWLCRDFSSFREGTAGALLMTFAQRYGDLDERLERALLEALSAWSEGATEGEESALSPELADEQSQEALVTAAEASEEGALSRYAVKGDVWVKENVYSGGLLMKLAEVAFKAAARSTQEWLSKELTHRLNALYRGDVPQPQRARSAETQGSEAEEPTEA